MNTDGGGWTAAFSGLNGSPNVFDHFDVGIYAGSCSDPAVKFPINNAVYQWLTGGIQNGWVSLPAATSVGVTPVNPNALPQVLWTGTGSNASFIFDSQDIVGGAQFTFASSYNVQNVFDGCNGLQDTSSVVRVLYR